MNAPDIYYETQEEPIKSCLLALRDIILAFDKQITADWKYSMPFFNYKGNRICYLWVDKKLKQPYIGIVNGNRIEDDRLIQEKRSRMKIMRFDPARNLPKKDISAILQKAINLQISSKL